MKKNIIQKLSIASAVALMATACIIDDPVAGPIIGGNPVEPDDPTSTEVFITADGDFSDWNDIPSDELVVSNVPDNAYYPTGRKVMVYAGTTFVNIYVEFDEQADKPVQVMHLYVDRDNDQTTGMGNSAWTNDAADLLFEGSFYDDDGNFAGYDPYIFAYTGEPLAGEWNWEELVAPGMDIAKCSEFVELDNGNKAFELTLLRTAIPGLGKVFRMGVALQYDWNDIAFLPAGPAVENNGERSHGAVENLLVGAKQTTTPSTPCNAQIDIDGDFSDWNALEAVDLFTTVAPDDAYYPSARKMMATYNADYLYIYLEYDGSEESNAGILDLYMDVDAAFDGNGFATTGAGTWVWANDGTELLIQGAVANFDAGILQYTGTPLAGEWAWTEVVAAGSGAMSGSDAVLLDNGNTAVEIALLRSAIPGLGNKTLLGVLFEKSDWSGECGALPALSAAEGSYVPAEKMTVDFTRQNTGDTPDPGPGPVTPSDAEIVIDGDLSDWNGIDASSAAVALIPDTPHYDGFKELRLTADKNYIYLYVAFDNSAEKDITRMTAYIDADMAFDAEGQATTGAGQWLYTNDGTDVMIQGVFFDETGNPGWSWAEMFMYSGNPLAGEWAWTSILPGGSGATNSSAAVDLGNGTSVVEVSIMRAAIPGLGSEVMVGASLADTGWSDQGILPAADETADGGHGTAEKLHIVLP